VGRNIGPACSCQVITACEHVEPWTLRESPQTSGGTTCAEAKSQTERLIRIARNVLDAAGYPMGQNKVSRIVRTFEARVAGNGWSFFDYFANSIQLDAQRRRELLARPDIARVICYADPTGETAVSRVMRQRRPS
jgi:hypothetical protein